MEVEVRAVAGMDSCFVALPLAVIDALDRGAGGRIPPILALELRPLSSAVADATGPWRFAWSGAASRSDAVEVAQQLAECVFLPAHTKAWLNVVSRLAKAEFVAIEPVCEDDWEVMELNSELAEETILKQVGIVYESMKFPLWLHGHSIVKFTVVSCFPNNSIVQLVPGTEVAVAPKKRGEKANCQHDGPTQRTKCEQVSSKALLRVQTAENKIIHKFDYGGTELGVFFTYAVLMHPDTAKNLSFANFQLVWISPKFLQYEILQSELAVSQKKGDAKNKEKNRNLVVPVICSDSVARGHIMLPLSLQHLVGADVYSWVYVRKYLSIGRNDLPLMSIAPLRFKMVKQNPEHNSDLHDQDPKVDWKYSNMHPEGRKLFHGNNVGPLNSEDFVSSLHGEKNASGDGELAFIYVKEVKKSLIKSWLIGQLKAVAAHLGQAELSSLILPPAILLHFEVVDPKLGSNMMELIYLLSVTYDKVLNSDFADSFNLAIDAGNGGLNNLELALGKLEVGEPLLIDLTLDYTKKNELSVTSLTWMEAKISDITKRLRVILSSDCRKLFRSVSCPHAGHILIHGPSGSGKTLLAKAAAKTLQEHQQILAHIIYVSCSKLARGQSSKMKEAFRCHISEALCHVPSIVILDDLDCVVSSSSKSEASQLSNPASGALTHYLADLLDEMWEKDMHSCGYGPIAFIATVQLPENLPGTLTASGRFDFHVQLSAPSEAERAAILKHEIVKRGLQCHEDTLSEIAFKCDGYYGYDLEMLVDRAVHAADPDGVLSMTHAHLEPITTELVKEYFLKAMKDFLPAAMRDVQKITGEGEKGGWEDVGGLADIRRVIKETIELPSKFPRIFSHPPIRLRTNILLYGPPGCGKTRLVAATAAAASLRFISVKGPELLNKYIGASEQAVRDLFSKASAAAPCLLFFDEFDSIAPKRGHDNTGVTDRVVNQLLTELDGVEILTGVFVFAATSRPDLLDAALLRPGRFDRLLFCDFPQWDERLDILRVLSRKAPLSTDVNLEKVASMTKGFSGADLQALMSDAQLAAVNEIVESGEYNKPGRVPVINQDLLTSVASKARPSISEIEKRRLADIYSQFMDSRKSVARQLCDTLD